MKNVMIRARFPEERYAPAKGAMLELKAYGQGSTLAVALRRAIESLLQKPEIRHKSPTYIYMSIGLDGEVPLPMLFQIAPIPEGRQSDSPR